MVLVEPSSDSPTPNYLSFSFISLFEKKREAIPLYGSKEEKLDESICKERRYNIFS